MRLVGRCTADSDVSYHLIMPDYSAYVLNADDTGTYTKVSYADKDYAKIKDAVDSASLQSRTIPFTVEFTDPDTGYRSFGRY